MWYACSIWGVKPLRGVGWQLVGVTPEFGVRQLLTTLWSCGVFFSDTVCLSQAHDVPTRPIGFESPGSRRGVHIVLSTAFTFWSVFRSDQHIYNVAPQGHLVEVFSHNCELALK